MGSSEATWDEETGAASAARVVMERRGFVWLAPYKVRPGRSFLDRLFSNYYIEFDDLPLLGPFVLKEADQVCGWLNGAYNLGRSSEMVDVKI